MSDAADEGIVKILVDVLDVSVELEQGAEERGKLLALETVVELVVREDLVQEGRQQLGQPLVAHRSFLEAHAVQEVEDVDECVDVVGECGGVGDQLKEQLQQWP